MSHTNFACLFFEEPTDLEVIAFSVYRFSSQVYIVKPNAVLIEIGKSRLLFSESSFLSDLKSALGEKTPFFRITLSPNPLFAFVMAKHDCELLSAPLHSLLDIIDPERKSEEAAKLTDKLLATLTKLQLRTLGDFKALPRSQFASRFGRVGLLLKARVDGEMVPDFKLIEFKERIFYRAELSSSYNGTLGFLISVIEENLRDKIFPPIRKRSGKLEELKITFILEANSLHPEQTRTFRVKFAEPQVNAEDSIGMIWTCVEVNLQRNPIDASTPILFIELEVLKWMVDLDEQVDAFDQSRTRKEKESLLLSRQKERVGDENVFRAEMTQERLPEKSWRKLVNLKETPKKQDVRGRVPVRPIYRLPNPHLIHVAKDRSTLSYRKKFHKIIEWEPMSEILQSHWFLNETGEFTNSYDRKYARVFLENGREVSVFEDVNGRFFLDGYSG